ncbi:hypothetical protein MKY09_11215 [Psychrobacillus sp. FSL K6-4046]|uniref:hypothetical protein n=1 Tax=Psychrobacillus sp. FSL K6-4046 TaxID=2921550 RepID=UPI00315A8C1F
MGKSNKPFYKKWWFWVIVIIIIIVLTTGGGDEDATNNTANEQTTNKTDDSNTADKPSGEKEETIKDDGKIKSGTYKVGTDIPAGEYIVFAKGYTYIESSKDSSGALESIIFNDNLSKEANSYVTLNDGEYFKFQDGEMYPVEQAPSVIPEDGVYTDGMYKIGKDIPAGEYKITLGTDSELGYYEVSKSSSHQLEDIVTNENVEADTYLTVSDGQYLKLQGVTINTK